MTSDEQPDPPAKRAFTVASLTLAVLAVVLVLSGVGAAFAIAGNNTSSDIRESSKRADCRTAYNADFTEVVRVRDSLNTTFNRELGAALLARVSGEPVDQTAVAEFERTNTALAAAQKAVDALPKLDDAVDHGYTLDGVHHPPCPG